MIYWFRLDMLNFMRVRAHSPPGIQNPSACTHLAAHLHPLVTLFKPRNQRSILNLLCTPAQVHCGTLACHCKPLRGSDPLRRMYPHWRSHRLRREGSQAVQSWELLGPFGWLMDEMARSWQPGCVIHAFERRGASSAA